MVDDKKIEMKPWSDFVEAQTPRFGKELVDKWLRTIKVVHFDAGNLYLEADDPFQLLWFEEHIRPRLGKELRNSNHRPIQVHLNLNEIKKTPPRKSTNRFAENIELKLAPDPIDPWATFENFVKGSDHALAIKALKNLADSPMPIYLYGPKGSGKSHLLMATAKLLADEKKISYFVQSETFTDHVVKAMRSGSMDAFRKTYRHVDALIVDDVQLFARRVATQEEFFHTFNALHLQGKPLIFAGDTPPSLLQEIESRLTSRFEWGLMLRVPPLSDELLLSVYKKRQDYLHVQLPDIITDFMVGTFKRPELLIRAIDTLLLRLHLEQKPIGMATPEICQSLLQQLILESKTTKKDMHMIVQVVAEIFGLTTEQIVGRSQTKECAIPRQVAMYLSKKELNLPYTAIGRFFSRDHSTVMASIKLVENEKSLNIKIAEALQKLRS